MHAILSLTCGALSAYHLAVGHLGISAGFAVLGTINLAMVYLDERLKNDKTKGF